MKNSVRYKKQKIVFPGIVRKGGTGEAALANTNASLRKLF